MELKIVKNKDFTCIILTLILTILTLFIVGYALSFIPNELDEQYIQENLTSPLKYFVAENSEKAQYFVLTILCPLLICAFYKICSLKKVEAIIYFLDNKIYHICTLFSIISIILYINSPMYQAKLISIRLDLLLIITCLLGLFMIKFKLNKVTNVLCLIASIIMMLFVTSIFINKTYANSYFTAHHFEAYYYPIFEVFNGKTIGIDFANLYGFYPYFFVAILKVFGELTIFRFSLIISTLILINFIAIFLVMWQNIKNKLIVFLSFLTILLISLTSIIDANGPYFQYIPHRTIMVTLVLLLCSLFIHSSNIKAKKIINILGIILIGVAPIWNFETGVVAIGIWILFKAYITAIESDIFSIVFIKKMMKNLIPIVLSVTLMYVLLFVFTYIKSGSLLHIKDMFLGQLVFYKTGFYMIQMKLWEPWMLLILIYIIGLLISLSNMLKLRNTNKEINKKENLIIFILSILGIGIFSYYQGRSHLYVFNHILWPAIILLGIYAEKCYANIKKNVFHLVWFSTILIILTGGTYSYFSNIKNNENLFRAIKRDDTIFQSEYQNKIQLIKNNINEEENIIMLTGTYSMDLTELKRKNLTSIYAHMDWFKNSDIINVLEILNTSSYKIIIDNEVYNTLNKFDELRTKETFERYELLASSDNTSIYVLKEK